MTALLVVLGVAGIVLGVTTETIYWLPGVALLAVAWDRYLRRGQLEATRRADRRRGWLR